MRVRIPVLKKRYDGFDKWRPKETAKIKFPTFDGLPKNAKVVLLDMMFGLDQYGLFGSKKKVGFPSVAYGGGNFIVGTLRDLVGGYAIYGQRIDGSGTLLDPAGFPIRDPIPPYGVESPQLSCLATQCFAAFTDYRTGYNEIYGARFLLDGTSLDPSGIADSTVSHTTHFPTVLNDGGKYFVVWQETRDADSDIYFNRVSP